MDWAKGSGLAERSRRSRHAGLAKAMTGSTRPPRRCQSAIRLAELRQLRPNVAASWTAKLRQTEARSSPDDLAGPQFGHEVLGPQKLVQLDIHRADVLQQVRI